MLKFRKPQSPTPASDAKLLQAQDEDILASLGVEGSEASPRETAEGEHVRVLIRELVDTVGESSPFFKQKSKMHTFAAVAAMQMLRRTVDTDKVGLFTPNGYERQLKEPVVSTVDLTLTDHDTHMGAEPLRNKIS